MKNYECEELNKLAQYLDKKNIKWRNRSDKGLSSTFERIHFKIKGTRWSAICGTMNGRIITYGNAKRPIELMVGNNDPEGWLTAGNVIKMIEGVNHV